MSLTRSQVMSRIQGRHTKPELILRRLLWQSGFRFRLHAKTPFGRPDLVFPGPKVAVFVDGCFWHGCPEHYVRPRTSTAFWAEKLAANVNRDVDQTRRLEQDGWRVCRVWEHEVFEQPASAAREIARSIRSRRWRPPTSWRVERVEQINPVTDLEQRYLRELRSKEEPRIDARKRTTRKWDATNVTVVKRSRERHRRHKL